MRTTLVPLPPLPEQQEIVRRVEGLFKLADKLETRYTTAQVQVDKLTQSILAKAFRGELVPQDPSDEPAEKLLERIREQRETAAQGKPQKTSVKQPAPRKQDLATAPHTASLSEPENIEPSSLSSRELEEAIASVEGFMVHLVNEDGRRIRADRGGFAPYPFERALRGDYSVKDWKETRFYKHYDGVVIEVLNANDEPAHGRTLLKNIQG